MKCEMWKHQYDEYNKYNTDSDYFWWKKRQISNIFYSDKIKKILSQKNIKINRNMLFAIYQCSSKYIKLLSMLKKKG